MAVRSQPRQVVQEALSQKYPSQKRAGGVAQYHKKKKKKKEKEKEKKSFQSVLSFLETKVTAESKVHG
jgi:type II secretory pathway component PulL